MANIFEKPERMAETALELLRRTVKGAGLFVHKYGKADYTGAKGDKVMIKRPPILKARDVGFRTRNQIVVDDLIQSRIEVALSKHPLSRVGLSPEEATLDVKSYVKDVQAPQVIAMVEDFDQSIADTLAAATYVHEVAFTEGAPGKTGDPRKVARRAKRLLDSSNVPATGRYWLVGSAVSEAVANCDKLLDVNTSGLPEALREGVVGKLSGFIIIDWSALEDDESYFVHNTAVALSTVAPVVPNGAAAGATVAGQGLAVTQVWSYDDDELKDMSTVHAFTGTSLVTDPKVETSGARKGLIKMKTVSGEQVPEMEFVRAVKVNFTEETEETGDETP